MLFPDVREFDERVYEADSTVQSAQPAPPTGLSRDRCDSSVIATTRECSKHKPYLANRERLHVLQSC